MRFWQYTAYSEMKRNLALSKNMQGETKRSDDVSFWQQHDILKNLRKSEGNGKFYSNNFRSPVPLPSLLLNVTEQRLHIRNENLVHVYL